MALCMAALAASARAETVELKLRKGSDPPDYGSADYGLEMRIPQHFMMQKNVNVPEEGPGFSSLAKKEPKYTSKQPFKRAAKLGSNYYAWAMDSTRLKTRGFDRLYFDFNRNGDLTDDKVIKAQSDGGSFGNANYRSSNFPSQVVEIEADGQRFECTFSMAVYLQLDEDGTINYSSARLSTAATRTGTITIDGKPHRICVIDFNSNGTFNDHYKLDLAARSQGSELYPAYGDMVVVDPSAKRSDRYGYSAVESADHQYLSNLLNIEDRYYTISVTASGDKVTVEPARRPMGAVVNGHGPYRAALYGKEGFIRIAGDKDKPVPVPAGEWQLVEYQIDLTNDKTKPATRPAGAASAPAPVKKKKSLSERLAGIFGDDAPSTIVSGPRYTMVTARGTADGKAVKVQAGQTEKLPFGPPYQPRAAVNWAGDKEARLEMKLVGVAGEVCSDLMVKGARPAEPTFRILKTNGELVRKGKFEFG
jgi:hypothetical protein